MSRKAKVKAPPEKAIDQTVANDAKKTEAAAESATESTPAAAAIVDGEGPAVASTADGAEATDDSAAGTDSLGEDQGAATTAPADSAALSEQDGQTSDPKDPSASDNTESAASAESASSETPIEELRADAGIDPTDDDELTDEQKAERDKFLAEMAAKRPHAFTHLASGRLVRYVIREATDEDAAVTRPMLVMSVNSHDIEDPDAGQISGVQFRDGNNDTRYDNIHGKETQRWIENARYDALTHKIGTWHWPNVAV